MELVAIAAIIVLLVWGLLRYTSNKSEYRRAAKRFARDPGGELADLNRQSTQPLVRAWGEYCGAYGPRFDHFRSMLAESFRSIGASDPDLSVSVVLVAGADRALQFLCASMELGTRDNYVEMSMTNSAYATRLGVSRTLSQLNLYSASPQNIAKARRELRADSDEKVVDFMDHMQGRILLETANGPIDDWNRCKAAHNILFWYRDFVVISLWNRFHGRTIDPLLTDSFDSVETKPYVAVSGSPP